MSTDNYPASVPAPPSPTPSDKALIGFKAPSFKPDELVLYFHPYNFYSQKVLFVLHEKNIDFTSYPVDLTNGEQYSSWFLKLNPKADVPVLQDGSLIVPESKYILNYLESKFHGDGIESLGVHDVNSKEFLRIQFYEDMLAKVPVGALGLGSFIHDDLKLVPKPPFIGPIRKSCLKNNEKIYELLKKSVTEVEVHKLYLLHKLDLQERRKRLVYSRMEFQKILDTVKSILLYIENDIKENPGREWLITSEFTMADISLGLLLHRLYLLGFENYYWGYGRMPHVESYFLRFMKRPAYQKLVPSNFEILKDIWQKTPSNYKIGAGAGFVGMAMFAAFAHK